jgi:hypothetical protein
MSKGAVSKRISNQLLKKLSSEFNKKTRKAAQTGRPQILQLKDLNFINETLEQFIERGKGSKSIKKVTVSKQDVKDAQAIAKSYQDRFVKKAGFTKITQTYEYAHIAEVLPNVAKDIRAGTSFIVASFSTAGRIKSRIIDKILKDKSKSLRARVKAKVDRGHGVAGGTAISSLQLAQAASLASKNGIDLAATPGLDDYLKGQFKEYEIDLKNLNLIKDVLVNYQTLVSPKGDLNANYIPIITFQDFYANRGIDAKDEKKILEIVRKFFTDTIGADGLINMKGSPSIKDKVEIHLVSPFVSLDKRNKNVKTTRRVKAAKDTQKKSAPSKTAAAGSIAIIQKKKAAKKDFSRKNPKNTQRSMFSIMAMINKKLPTTIQKNMTEPALVNRTGRFANSVRIMEVTETRKGFPSFGYSYDKEPYQVFEMGKGRAPWATTDRDPRTLIDSSIREIAAELALGRFYTRRL